MRSGDLVISPPTAEDMPTGVTAPKLELIALPFAPIVSLPMELNKRTSYLECFAHADSKQPCAHELKRNLIAVLVDHSRNSA